MHFKVTVYTRRYMDEETVALEKAGGTRAGRQPVPQLVPPGKQAVPRCSSATERFQRNPHKFFDLR